jgi:hypothetical protein
MSRPPRGAVWIVAFAAAVVVGLVLAGAERPAGWTWIVAGAAVAVAGAARGARATALLEDRERHLARCRRRREPASVLVARVEGRVGLCAEDLIGSLRVTDSVTVRRTRRGFELGGVFDEQGLVREGLELRLRALAGGGAVQLGWSRFPEDGVTLPILLERARERLPDEAPTAHGRALRRLLRSSSAVEAK